MATDAKVTSLTAVPAVGSVALAAIAVPPAGMECLSYMQPAKVEFWAASVNNLLSASKVGESVSGLFSHSGLADGVTRYYWARAVDADGNFGAYYPVGGGVQATTQIPIPDGSVTEGKLADGAVTPTKMTVDQLSAIAADIGSIIAGTVTGVLFRTSASGRRIETDGTINYIKVYNSAGNIVGRLGELGSLDSLFSITRDIAYDNVLISNNNASGTAIRTIGRISMAPPTTGAFDNNLLDVVNNKTSNNAHAARLRNSASGGGEAVMGVSAGGGGYAMNAQTGGVYSGGGYLPFTGKHETLAKKDAGIKVGDIVVVKRIIAKDGLDNVLTEVVTADQVGDRRVIGVVSAIKEIPSGAPIAGLGGLPSDAAAKQKRRRLAKAYNHITVNALGEGQMDVCGRGGNIEAGDYIITSDLAGKGQRIDMDQPVTFKAQASIVAQAMVAVTFETADQVKRVPCFYRCG
jgi:predicted phage tail protein